MNSKPKLLRKANLISYVIGRYKEITKHTFDHSKIPKDVIRVMAIQALLIQTMYETSEESEQVPFEDWKDNLYKRGMEMASASWLNDHVRKLDNVDEALCRILAHETTEFHA